ncbi:hypothetical protein [Paraburkholderia sp. DHOC27]|uniref:hypothetical protein n=1 Tax=Paraburkholderia sp. DHOC27 TaxID=2303330 RepID=UPI000E3B8EC3|nr:hypothetical protein [Paraburkholderia sp. DHOC27]RFU49836.1 hypothetical protein D0B32_03765 [Paraburkholderia sp. DHOC27]
MRYLPASIFTALIALTAVAVQTPAMAQTSGGGDTPQQQCAMGYVTGIGGAARSMREYLALPDGDKYRYLADNPIQCKVSDEGRASDCNGVINLRHEQISVYDDSDSVTMSVVTRVELDHGTYPAIIVVQKKDVHCEQ